MKTGRREVSRLQETTLDGLSGYPGGSCRQHTSIRPEGGVGDWTYRVMVDMLSQELEGDRAQRRVYK
jgi:hypothetical protein